MELNRLFLLFLKQKKKMKYKPLFLIVLFLLGSCAEKQEIRHLEEVETILQEKPDSALTLLQAMDQSTIRSKKGRALWALLTSAALDKNYIDVTSDSLINNAVNYYSPKNDVHHRMLAYYYQGLVDKNAKNYNYAIISFEKALSDAVLNKDYYYLGLIYRNIAEVFNNTDNIPSAIENIQKSIASFDKAKKKNYSDYAKLALVYYYYNNQNYTEALQSLKDIDNTPEIKEQCQKIEAGILTILNEDLERAIHLFQGVSPRLMNLHDCSLYALALESCNRSAEADLWLAEAYHRSSNVAKKGEVEYTHGRIEELRGNYEAAYRLTRHASHVQDSVIRALLKESVTATQRDFYKTESLLQKEKADRTHDRLLFSILISTLLMIIGGLYLVMKRNEADRTQKEQMLEFSHQQQQLEKTKKDNAALLGSLFREKLNHLDFISDSYLKAENDKDKYQAFKEFKAEIAAMRKDEDLFASLERDLNLYCDGIMEKLKQQVPSIKGENKKIIMLFFANLPYDTVQLVLNKNSIDSLRTTRSRFRKAIKAADAPDAELFLSMLDMKQ